MRHYLSPTYNEVLISLPRQFNSHSHLGSPRPSNPHDGQLNRRLTSGPNISVRTLPHRVYKSATPLQYLDEMWNVFNKLKQVQLPVILPILAPKSLLLHKIFASFVCNSRTLPHRVCKPATPLQLLDEMGRLDCLQETEISPVANHLSCSLFQIFSFV